MSNWILILGDLLMIIEYVFYILGIIAFIKYIKKH